jgi:hypothetical protein
MSDDTKDLRVNIDLANDNYAIRVKAMDIFSSQLDHCLIGHLLIERIKFLMNLFMISSDLLSIHRYACRSVQH